MKTSYAAVIALSLSTLAAGYASAETTLPGIASFTEASVSSKTRDQVLAELADAQRTGDVFAAGNDSGKKLNELRPDLYPAKAVQPGKTRQQVLAELVQAQRSSEFTLHQNRGG